MQFPGARDGRRAVIVTIPSSPLAVLALALRGARPRASSSATSSGGPRSDHATKLWLLLGLGVFPIGAAGAGNVEGFEATKKRALLRLVPRHGPHAADSDDLREPLALVAARAQRLFGDENCYACHADYGMFGTVVTKLGGMRHVWLYYTEYRNTPIEEAKKTIHFARPTRTATACSATRPQGSSGDGSRTTRRLSTDVRRARELRERRLPRPSAPELHRPRIATRRRSSNHDEENAPPPNADGRLHLRARGHWPYDVVAVRPTPTSGRGSDVAWAGVRNGVARAVPIRGGHRSSHRPQRGLGRGRLIAHVSAA